MSFTLAEGFHPAEQSKKNAFTLAEVLFTLGIIGVVAALTIPTLIQNYSNHLVETRLQKFYSTINNAVKLSAIENGETRNWALASYDYEHNQPASPEQIAEFYDKYFGKYIKTAKTNITQTDAGKRYFSVYFFDGSAVLLKWQGSDWLYFPNSKNIKTMMPDMIGSKYFEFGFYPSTAEQPYTHKHYYNKGVEPYVPHYIKDDNGMLYKTDDSNLYEANAYTAIIQRNGWKIPKDYPKKITY